MGDEERDDRRERAEAERQAEERAVQQIHADVVAQMRTDVFFHVGEGEHGRDSTISIFALDKICLKMLK